MQIKQKMRSPTSLRQRHLTDYMRSSRNHYTEGSSELLLLHAISDLYYNTNQDKMMVPNPCYTYGFGTSTAITDLPVHLGSMDMAVHGVDVVVLQNPSHTGLLQVIDNDRSWSLAEEFQV